MMLCVYFGGAIATDIHSPKYLYQPLVVLSLVLMTALFKKPKIFHESFKIEWSDRVRLTLDKISLS
jgi:hypothetical protein